MSDPILIPRQRPIAKPKPGRLSMDELTKNPVDDYDINRALGIKDRVPVSAFQSSI